MVGRFYEYGIVTYKINECIRKKRGNECKTFVNWKGKEGREIRKGKSADV